MSKMLTAKVTKAFPGKPDDEAKVRDIAVDEFVSGELAQVAIAQGWADEVAAGEAAAGDDAPAGGRKKRSAGSRKKRSGGSRKKRAGGSPKKAK